MKKIGILTRHCYPNYGSILQTYALQTALEKLGAQPIVLDYVSKDDGAFGLIKANLRISKKARTWLGSSAYILAQTPTFLSMFHTFRGHQRRLLKLSDQVTDSNGLARLAADLDLVIAGSDQIWNRIIDSIDMNYFLPFMPDRSQRYSYAASLGSVAPLPGDEQLFLNAICAMNVVSVREPTSAEWIVKKGIPARADVDPVLLHEREFWQNFCPTEKKNFQYILVYQLHNTKSFTHRLNQIKERMDLPVIRLTPDWKHVLLQGKTKILLSPEAFLGWIRDAACIVTDSFHGTSFGLKFGRPLYIVPPGKYSTRLSDVVERVGMQRLVVSSNNDLPLPDTPEYDGDEVEERLQNQAAISWDYLRTVVKEP